MSGVIESLRERVSEGVRNFGLARWIIVAFLVLIWIVAAVATSLNLGTMLGDCLTRAGMNGILVLALVLPVRAGNGLNFGRAGLSRRFKYAQRIVDVGRLRKGAGQNDAVLDCHGGALSHVGCHRMRCISNQNHASVKPAFQRFAFEDRPTMNHRTGPQHLVHFCVKI